MHRQPMTAGRAFAEPAPAHGRSHGGAKILACLACCAILAGTVAAEPASIPEARPGATSAAASQSPPTVSDAARQPIAPLFELPPPTGTAIVGTTRWNLVDTGRGETLGTTGGPREIEVIAYYPAQAGAANAVPAPYLRAGESEALPLFRELAARASLGAVHTHAVLDAAPLDAPGHLPLLVFSHGFAGFPSAHAALLEDLASHGYVILSVQHPYESAAAQLSNGHVVSFLDEIGTPYPNLSAVFGEWEHEDETLARATAAKDDAAALAILRGYVRGLPKTNAVVQRWVLDTRLALDRLPSLPASAVAGRLARRVDASRVGVFGHSMGGVVAAEFCSEDARCAAGLNLDGSPQSGTLIDPPGPRSSRRFAFLMAYSARPGRVGANDPIYRGAAAPYWRVDVRDTLHLDFCDLDFWGGPLREHHAFGTIAPARAAELTRRLVREYFDQTMLGRPSPLLAGRASEPELAILPSGRAPASPHP